MQEEDVKQVTIISGKGGTGKSSLIAALASNLKEHIILADADVDAADLYLKMLGRSWGFIDGGKIVEGVYYPGRIVQMLQEMVSGNYKISSKVPKIQKELEKETVSNAINVMIARRNFNFQDDL